MKTMLKTLPHAGRCLAVQAGLAGVLVAALSAPAWAAGEGLPPLRQQGAVSYVSGGIGDGESSRFESAASGFPLVVQLFERAGSANQFTADAVVKIVDARGQTVLDQKADGPFMLVRLAAGDYRISASLKGKSLPEQKVQVTERGHTKATFIFGPNAG